MDSYKAAICSQYAVCFKTCCQHTVHETIFHLFIECQYVEDPWKRLEQWIYEKCNILFDFSHIEILFGKINRKFTALNLIILLVKQYIYKKRLKQELINSIDKYIHKINGNSDLFHKKWQIFDGLMEI